MKVLWYCPNCRKEEIKDRLPNSEEERGVSLRDGFGTPIRFYHCECGSDLAGAMHFGVVKEVTSGNVEYFKGVIELYSKP